VTAPTTPEEVERKLIEMASRVFKWPAEGITAASRFREDLGADSLDLTVLVYEFEDNFGLLIPDEEVMQMKTIGDVVQYVLRVTKT
jgi:acyl carrier protein